MGSRPKTEKLPRVASRRRLWLRRALVWGGAAAAGMFVLLVALVLYCRATIDVKLESVRDYHPKQVTKVLAADGELIGEIFEERRTVVPIDKIPKVMRHAIVDAEDAGFYEHEGLSYKGIARALVNDLLGRHAQGASTITQQLVRNFLLHDTSRHGLAGLTRKIREMILARRIESHLAKDEILWMYLNQIEFPYQRFGVEEAAHFYYGKSVADVNVGEAALLASLPKGPTEIDPWKHPERAKDRQRYVLSQMERYRHITHEEAQKWAAEPIQVVRSPAPFVGSAPEFVDQVKRVLAERIGLKTVSTLGLSVVTTCDARIQKLTREAVEKNLQLLDERQGYRKPLAHLEGRALAAHLKKLGQAFPADRPAKNLPWGTIFEAVVRGVVKEPVVGVEVDLGSTTGFLSLPASPDRYNPKGLAPDKRFRPGDVVRVSLLEWKAGERPIFAAEFGPQAAVVVLDPNTREVKALVGGYGYKPGNFDHGIVAKRPPGSAFKPFVYATAFSTEKFTPATVMIDSPQVYASPGMAPWKPQNAEKDEYHGPVRLRVALALSLNTVASQLVDVQRGGVDPAAVVQLAHEMGIESELAPNPSLALGAAEVSVLEMTNAYATFAAGGKRMPAELVRAIGNQPEPAAQSAVITAMKPELAYLVTSTMTSVIEEGTGVAARGRLHRPAAGKTGTVVDAHGKHTDAWFVGYTPDLVTGVWVGFDDRHELGRGEQGARAALPIWIDVMAGALKTIPPKPFAQPPGVVVHKIDPKSGLLAPPGLTGALDEVFLDGTAPTQTAPVGEANPDTYFIDQQQ